MFILAHTSDFEYKSKESWRSKLAQAILNDEKSAILQEDIISKYEKLQTQIEKCNYVNEQLCIQNHSLIAQNVEVLKQYDKLMNYQIYKLALSFSVLSCIFMYIIIRFLIARFSKENNSASKLFNELEEFSEKKTKI